MKVVKLIEYSDEAFEGLEENTLARMGGWFNSHMIHKKEESHSNHTWQDYLDSLQDDKTREYAIALKKYILENNIHECAPWHQSVGVPLFEDNTYATFSYRGWGDLMAAIYTTDEKPLDYMSYYM
jgi:hypothetical protein